VHLGTSTRVKRILRDSALTGEELASFAAKRMARTWNESGRNTPKSRTSGSVGERAPSGTLPCPCGRLVDRHVDASETRASSPVSTGSRSSRIASPCPGAGCGGAPAIGPGSSVSPIVSAFRLGHRAAAHVPEEDWSYCALATMCRGRRGARGATERADGRRALDQPMAPFSRRPRRRRVLHLDGVLLGGDPADHHRTGPTTMLEAGPRCGWTAS